MSELTKEIQRKLAKLEALEAGGVDNWEYYDVSLENWRAETEAEAAAESIIDDILSVIHDHIEEPAGRGCGYGIKTKGYQLATEILLKRKGELVGA